MPDTIEYRLGQLEKKVDTNCVRMDKILTNDIPHIQTKLENLDGKVDNLRTRIDLLSIINIGAIIIALLVKEFLQ